MFVRREKDNTTEQITWNGQQGDLRFQDHSERAFGAAEQIDPIHAGGKPIAGGVLGRTGGGNSGHGEIDLVSTAIVFYTAIHQRDTQGEDMTARTAVAEAARSAGIGGD